MKLLIMRGRRGKRRLRKRKGDGASDRAVDPLVQGGEKKKKKWHVDITSIAAPLVGEGEEKGTKRPSGRKKKGTMGKISRFVPPPAKKKKGKGEFRTPLSGEEARGKAGKKSNDGAATLFLKNLKGKKGKKKKKKGGSDRLWKRKKLRRHERKKRKKRRDARRRLSRRRAGGEEKGGVRRSQCPVRGS